MNKYFDINDSIFDIVNKYDEALNLLVNVGLDNIANPFVLQNMGKKISLKNALIAKNLNVDLVEKQLIDAIEEHLFYAKTDISLGALQKKDLKSDVSVDGVLPCPIRIPLQESFEEYIKSEDVNFSVSHNLKSANLGIDDIKELALKKDINLMPDIILSAGFELFFDPNLMGNFFESDKFATSLSQMNDDFDNANISFVDPKQRYAIVAVVPAIFIVNEDELHGRKTPKTWEDILSDEFENSIDIPMRDLDLFNALIIHIYKLYGDEGIRKLAKNYHKSMHPSQMVKSTNATKSAVSIAPYFFSSFLRQNGNIKAIWPLDGAIVSPIFLVAKSGNENVKKIAEFFLSEKAGHILSHGGKFPSTNKYVNNHLDKNQKFIWLGFDYIYSHNIADEIRHCENLFYELINEGV